MATSPSHELGEMIGNFFEDVMKSPIREICAKYNVYFDTIGPRPARNSKKITWQDINGSKHDLDYVIERNGTSDNIGEPIGFIELAWRRYTKHSKNKVQEIAGAVLPIVEKYKELAPFKGAILSGEFTEPSLKQLENQGFHVLYVPFANVVTSFEKYGVNLFFDENTSEAKLAQIVRKFNSCRKMDLIRQDFIESNQDIIKGFMDSLEASLRRHIKSILILPLHGKGVTFTNLRHAIKYIKSYNNIPEDAPLDRFGICIDFNDGSCIQCEFKDKDMAMNFLHRNCREYGEHWEDLEKLKI